MSQASSTPLAVSLEALNPDERGVRVEFHWTGNRFSHTILGLDGGQAIPLLESIENIAAESVSPRPALIELHQQDEAIFLTGATDVGHWSMSVELADAAGRVADTLPSSAERFLLFDVACRLRTGIGPLRSNYRCASADIVCKQSDQGAVVTGESSHSAMLGPVTLPDQNNCRIVCDHDLKNLSVTPAGKCPEGFPATIRWQYGLFFPAS